MALTQAAEYVREKMASGEVPMTRAVLREVIALRKWAVLGDPFGKRGALRGVTRYRWTKARWSARKVRRYRQGVLPLAELGTKYLVSPRGEVYYRGEDRLEKV